MDHLLEIAVVTNRRTYRTDLSDARWALIEPVLSAWRAARAEAGLGLSAPVHDLREIVNAILYVNRTGIAWEYLPQRFPAVQDGLRLLRQVGSRWDHSGHPRPARPGPRAGRAVAGAERGDHRRADGEGFLQRSRRNPGVRRGQTHEGPQAEHRA